MGINKEKLLKEIKLKSDDVDVTWVCSFIKNFPEEPEIDFDLLHKEFISTKCIGKKCNSCQYVNTSDDVGACFSEFLKSKNLTQPQIDMDQLRNEVYSEIVKNSNIGMTDIDLNALINDELCERAKDYTITKCASCGIIKNAPLRRDDMGGYVCLSCIDFELTKRSNTPKPFEIPVKCPSCGCPSFKIEDLMICCACGNVFELTRKFEIPVNHRWKLKKEYEEIFDDFNINKERVIESHQMKYFDHYEEHDYSKIPKGSWIMLKEHGGTYVRCFIRVEGDNLIVGTTSESESKWHKSTFVRIVELAKE